MQVKKNIAFFFLFFSFVIRRKIWTTISKHLANYFINDVKRDAFYSVKEKESKKLHADDVDLVCFTYLGVFLVYFIF